MKKKDKKTEPTTAELAILQILWSEGPLSVKEVHEVLEQSKPVVYTTTLKTMQVMHQREMLTREAQGRKHIYSAAIEQIDTQNKLLDNFLSRAFGGSSKKLVMRTLGQHSLKEDELIELKAFINSLDANDQKSKS